MRPSLFLDVTQRRLAVQSKMRNIPEERKFRQYKYLKIMKQMYKIRAYYSQKYVRVLSKVGNFGVLKKGSVSSQIKQSEVWLQFTGHFMHISYRLWLKHDLKEGRKFILKGVPGPWNTVTSNKPIYCKDYVVCVCKFLIHYMDKTKVFFKSKKS